MISAQSVRSVVPVPKQNHALIAWAVFLLGAIWIYDIYDGRGRQGPWPASAMFPW